MERIEYIEAEDGRDHLYKHEGEFWRVRIRKFEEISDEAAVNGNVNVAPDKVSYIIRVAALDKKKNVKTNGKGQIILSEPFVLTIQGANVEESIEASILNQIENAKKQLEAINNRSKAEDKWL